MSYTRLDTEYTNGKVWNGTAVSKIDNSFEALWNYVTPQMYGAVADGTADDTVAV
jgi:hypothetical protein